MVAERSTCEWNCEDTLPIVPIFGMPHGRPWMIALAFRIRSLRNFPNGRKGPAILIHAALVLIASCILGHAAEPDSWERSPNNAHLQWLSLPAVPAADIYEVVPTRIGTALVWHLARAPFAVLTRADADFLAGGHYNCDGGKKQILVRAVFANGGTGNFTARYDSKTLYVHHGSLGDDLGPIKNLPLIVSLRSIPMEVYAWATSIK